MTYNVFGVTLSLTQSIKFPSEHQSLLLSTFSILADSVATDHFSCFSAMQSLLTQDRKRKQNQ